MTDDATAVVKLKQKYFRKNLPADVQDALLKLANGLTVSMGRTSKTILVLSSLPAEGTTFIALNLVKTLSCMSTYRVLLIDANLRSSAFESWCSKQLSTAALTPEKMPQKTDIENLWFISLCKTSSQPPAIPDYSKVKKILEALYASFDFIILDGAPLNPYPDSLSIIPCVDGVVLVVSAHKTRREVVQKAKETLESKQANILGVVINKRKYFIPRYIYKHL